MNESERLNEIQKRLKDNEYFVNPLSDVNVAKDIEFLISLINEKNEAMAKLSKKNEILALQVMELNQEIENVKGDFGNQTR